MDRNIVVEIRDMQDPACRCRIPDGTRGLHVVDAGVVWADGCRAEERLLDTPRKSLAQILIWKEPLLIRERSR